MQRQKYIYLSIIVVCLIIISTSIYYVLGGFEKVEIFFFEGTSRAVIGKEHYMSNRNFRQKMDSARIDIQEGKLKGMLTAVLYQSDTIPQDSILCFIGASQDDINGVVRMPAGYQYKHFKTDRIYKIFISQHPLVMPKPEEIEQMMEIKAIEEGELLQPVTFELYYEDNSLSVEKWVK